MRLITCRDGALRDAIAASAVGPAASFRTGLAALDAAAPGGAFSRGAVHEVLADPADGVPAMFALLLARAAAAGGRGAVVWSDPRRTAYPPALAAARLAPPGRLYLLYPRGPADEVWAAVECLRCPGVAAVVAAPGRLGRVEARRLQLAAERGGGVGILLRTDGTAAAHFAAATRWRVRPAPGGPGVQRWAVRAARGPGGPAEREFLLEVCRDTGDVRAVDAVADRPGEAAAPAARSTA